ncbi:MAG: hypothetical protein HKN23_13405 [Verrucomicrobiales bacterium]|nr:hypothetical protein [Verrucomicrobiales bacterium]
MYSDHGHGWHREATLRPGQRRQLHAENGEEWGFDDPHRGGINILKSTTIKNFDMFPVLMINDRELGHGGGPPVRDRTIHVNNYSSDPLKIYRDSGSGFRYVDSIRAGGHEDYVATPGDDWGFDDPHKPGVNIFKHVTVKTLVDSTLSARDSDFHSGGGPGPGPGPGRQITLANNTSRTVSAYSDDGRGWYREGSLSPGARRTYNAKVGEEWGFDDPGQSGVNIVRKTTVKAWGSNTLAISNGDIAPPDPKTVSITFRNEGNETVNISLRTGPFSKKLITSVGPYGSRTVKLIPGDKIVLNEPGKRIGKAYTAPAFSTTHRFDL